MFPTGWMGGRPAMPNGNHASFIKRTVYSVAGTFTWTKNPRTTTINVTVQGAGGTGGNGSTTPAAGGGQGGFAVGLIDATALTSVTVTMANPAGGTTSFGSLITATAGGNGGINQGGLSGTSAGGDINISGQAGSPSAFSGAGPGVMVEESEVVKVEQQRPVMVSQVQVEAAGVEVVVMRRLAAQEVLAQ